MNYNQMAYFIVGMIVIGMMAVITLRVYQLNIRIIKCFISIDL